MGRGLTPRIPSLASIHTPRDRRLVLKDVLGSQGDPIAANLAGTVMVQDRHRPGVLLELLHKGAEFAVLVVLGEHFGDVVRPGQGGQFGSAQGAHDLVGSARGVGRHAEPAGLEVAGYHVRDVLRGGTDHGEGHAFAVGGSLGTGAWEEGFCAAFLEVPAMGWGGR